MCSVQVHCRHSHLLCSCIELLNIYSVRLGSVSLSLSSNFKDWSLVSSVQVGCRQQQQLPAISLPTHIHKNKLNVKDTLVLLVMMLIGPQDPIIAAPVAWVTLIQKTLNSYRGLLLQTKEYYFGLWNWLICVRSVLCERMPPHKYPVSERFASLF